MTMRAEGVAQQFSALFELLRVCTDRRQKILQKKLQYFKITKENKNERYQQEQ